MLITIPEGSAPLGDEENPTRRELDIEIVTTLFDNVWDFLRIDSVVKHSLISNSRSLFDPAYMLFLFGDEPLPEKLHGVIDVYFTGVFSKQRSSYVHMDITNKCGRRIGHDVSRLTFQGRSLDTLHLTRFWHGYGVTNHGFFSRTKRKWSRKRVEKDLPKEMESIQVAGLRQFTEFLEHARQKYGVDDPLARGKEHIARMCDPTYQWNPF